MSSFDEPEFTPPRKSEAHKSMTGAVTSGIAWTGSLYFLQVLLQLAFMAVLARILAPAEFGVAAAANFFILFVRLFSEIGIAQTIVQIPQISDRLLRVGFTIVLALSIFLFGLTEACAPFVEAWFQQPGLTEVVRVVGVIFLVQAFSVIPQNLLYRRLQAKIVNISLLISMIIGTGLVAIPLAFYGWSYWALIAGAIVQEIAFAFVLAFQIKVPRLFAFTFEEASELFNTSVGFSLSRVLGFFASFGDNLIVGRYFSADMLGIYSRAYNLMNMPSAVYGAVADRVVFPAMSRVQDQPHRLSAAFFQGTELTASIGIPLTAFLILTAQDLVIVLLGHQWHAAIVPFEILALAMYPRLACRVCASLIRSVGQVKVLIVLQGAQAAATLLFCYMAYPFGLNFVALAVSAAQILSFTFFLIAACRIVPAGPKDFLRSHGHGFLLGLVVTLTSLVALACYNYHYDEPFFRLVVTTLACAFVVTLCVAFFPKIFLGPTGLLFVETIWQKIVARATSGKSKPPL